MSKRTDIMAGGVMRALPYMAAFMLAMAFACPAFAATLAGWDVHSLAGGSGNFGASPLAATASDSNLTVGGLTRGSGVGTSGTAAARAWGGNDWQNTTAAGAVTGNDYATFTLSANSGHKVSFSSISKFDYRRSSTGATSGVLQYQIGTGSFTDIATLSYLSSSSSGASLSAIDLSGISALQNVPAGTTVTFRVVNYGGTSSSGTWYIFDTANTTANDFEIQGTVTTDFVNGACGGDNVSPLAKTAPTDLCSTGTPSAITGSGHPWNWTCAGTGGGTTASCSATIASHTLNFAAGANGTVSGTTPQTVDYGQSATAVTAVPAEGYSFQNWTGTGGFVTSTANPLTVTNVTAGQTITANFSSAVVDGACGSDNGQTLAATAPSNLCSAGTPSAITGSGHPWSWSCTGINGGNTATCSANIQSYTLTFSAGSKGTLSGTTPQTIDYGGSTTPVSVTPNSGNTFLNWTGTGGFATTTANPLTIANVTSDMAVTANYSGVISIFHVNDTHARLTPHKMMPPMHGTGTSPFEDVGGAAHMAGKMLELTASNPDSLVLDAGDISEGNPIGDMTFEGCAPGGTPGMGSNCGMTKFYEMLSNKLKNVPGRNGRGMDAVVVGNHDVRDSSYVGNLEALRASGVPVLSVNVRDTATGLPHFAPYTIVNVAGRKVGVLGYTTQTAEVGASLAGTLEVVECDWSGTTAPCHLSDYVNELRNAPNNVDIVVLLAHIGHSGMVDPNPAVSAKLLVDNGVAKLPEVVVAGHWHTWAETPAWQPELLNYKTTFTEAGSYMSYIGELKISDTGAYVGAVNHLLRNADITPDPDVQTFVSSLVTLYDANAATQGKPRAFDVVGYTADNLLLDNEMRWWSPNEYPWSGNNPAGQWICDAMRWKAAQLFGSCDLAIETGGGVRADIPAGPVTYLQVYETFPWSDDTYVRIDMTGQDIINFLKATNLNSGFSRGLTVTGVDGVPTDVRFNGSPISLSQTYTVAVNNYMLAHPPSGYTWPNHSTPLTDPSLVRDSLVEFMQANHSTQAGAYAVGGPRYILNTEYSGGYRAVVTMLNDSDTRPTFEDAFIRFLSATPETLTRRGTGRVPADLVNEDGTINPAHHLAEQEWYRSYLGFKAGALKNGDIVEIWGKGSFFDGNPEFVEQEGVYGDGLEFKIVGHDESLAKPAFKSSINEFWNDHHKNHYVQFLARKTGTSAVQDQSGQTITISDRTAYNNYSLPGNVGDVLLITGVPTMENFGLRFRCDSAVVSGSLPAASAVSSHVNPVSAGVTASPLTLTATASTTAGIYNLPPIADAQVASGYPTSNYGSSGNIFIQSDNSGYGNERGWLRFDLSSIPAGSTVSGATLKLWNWKSSGASLPVEARGSSTDSWTETGITWNGQPSYGAVLDTQTLVSGVTSVWYDWNVTSFVQSEFSGDRTVSLLVKAVTEDSTDTTAPSYSFDSKEFGSNAPVLQVQTGASGATITQVQYYYRYSSDNTAWSAWTATGLPVTTSPYTMSFTFPNGQGYYEFYSRATDSNGNVEPAPAAAHSFTHYSQAPAYSTEAIATLSGLSATYDGSSRTVAMTTVPPGLSYSITYNGGSTAPVNAGSYGVTATVTQPGYSGSVAGTLVIEKAAATVALGELSFTADGTAKSVAVTTTPSGLPVTVTYDGSTTPPSAAGSYAVVATVSDPNYQGSATGTMTIAETTAAPVPAIGPWGMMAAAALLGGFSLRAKSRKS